MFGNLKTQLLLSSVAAMALLLMGIWASVHGLMGWATAIFIALCVYVVAVNLWFRWYVSAPLGRLTDFARRISAGSYGIKTEDFDEDEIGCLAEEINNISEKTGVAEKTRTEFISQVSHELRTPLTAITGWAETIAFDPAVQGDSLKGINIISKEAERLTNLVKELLEFTRIQDGRFNLNIEKLDIAAELEDALFTYGELMKQAGMKVSYSGPPREIPLIPGDSERLKQVFLNLLDNAMKHGGDGGRIDVTLRQDQDRVRIGVRDYGHGIPEAELPHVKERFYKGSSRNRGTGIGLAVCDEIVTRHGGTLTVENAPAPEGGCLVTVLLPMSGTAAVKEQKAPAPAKAPASAKAPAQREGRSAALIREAKAAAAKEARTPAHVKEGPPAQPREARPPAHVKESAPASAAKEARAPAHVKQTPAPAKEQTPAAAPAKVQAPAPAKAPAVAPVKENPAPAPAKEQTPAPAPIKENPAPAPAAAPVKESPAVAPAKESPAAPAPAPANENPAPAPARDGG